MDLQRRVAAYPGLQIHWLYGDVSGPGVATSSNMQNTIYMLFGAALVCLGVLASALADRIRALSVSREGRESAPRERSSRAAAASVARGPIQVVESAESAELPRKPVAPRRTSEAKARTDEGGDDVISVLVASGYKKALATEATWACTPSERATVEHWTAAALRRCARGGMS